MAFFGLFSSSTAGNAIAQDDESWDEADTLDNGEDETISLTGTSDDETEETDDAIESKFE